MPSRQQAIIWTNDGLLYSRIHESFGLNEKFKVGNTFDFVSVSDGDRVVSGELGPTQSCATHCKMWAACSWGHICHLPACREAFPFANKKGKQYPFSRSKIIMTLSKSLLWRENQLVRNSAKWLYLNIYIYEYTGATFSEISLAPIYNYPFYANLILMVLYNRHGGQDVEVMCESQIKRHYHVY